MPPQTHAKTPAEGNSDASKAPLAQGGSGAADGAVTPRVQFNEE